MSDRHEFRFVVDGLELDEHQRTHIASAVQTAALGALASSRAVVDSPVVIGHANLALMPEWYGLWVINGLRGRELGDKIQDIGFFRG